MEQNSITPIGKDVHRAYGFVFGMYRYQVEHFDHNKSDKEHGDKYDDVIKMQTYWDTLYGTKVYRFYDSEYGGHVDTCLLMYTYIEQDDLEKMILADTINWKAEDPYDFKDLILTDRYNIYLNGLFTRKKGHVDHGYPECKYPYEKCPICGGDLDDDVLEPDCAVDVFNGYSGSNEDGAYGGCEEIHRCPHCDKLFYVDIDY